MPEQPINDRRLRIVHVLRAPVGGLFRHVLDLANAQIAAGHEVGIIADSLTGGSWADTVLDKLEPRLTLGLRRFPMHRGPHPSDMPALWRVAAAARAWRPDVLHGHGSKGAFYSRMATMLPGASRSMVRAYTPHGGSLHFGAGSPAHKSYLWAERLLALRSDLILFESAYAANRYRSAVGAPPCLSRVALNGIGNHEFERIRPNDDAADFVYVGELRELKGVDILLEALATASAAIGRPLKAVLVGSGPDRGLLEARASRLSIADQVVFAGALAARTAFALGRILVVPSRAESLPYVVLEAAGAQVPMIATNVGGIPEIFGIHEHLLLPAGDPEALGSRMVEELRRPSSETARTTRRIAEHVQSRFSVDRMVESVMAAYRDALARKTEAGPSRQPTVPFQPHRYGF